MRPCLLQHDFVITVKSFPPTLAVNQIDNNYLRILTSSDPVVIVIIIPSKFIPCHRPRCIVTTVSSGVDFMVNQRPCVDHPHTCSLDPLAGGGLFHATFENASGRIRSRIHPSILVIYCSMQRSRMHLGSIRSRIHPSRRSRNQSGEEIG